MNKMATVTITITDNEVDNAKEKNPDMSHLNVSFESIPGIKKGSYDNLTEAQKEGLLMISRMKDQSEGDGHFEVLNTKTRPSK